MAKFERAEDMQQQLEAVRPGIRSQKAMVATITKQWPDWDWTIPRDRTPPFWSERTLAGLRWCALRYQD